MPAAILRPSVAVIVVAAGSGTRLGLGQPKAFVSLAGRPILSRSLDAIFALDDETQVVVVVPADRVEQAGDIVAQVAGAAVGYATVVVGGESRQASVEAGLAALAESVDIVLVHDAARALTPTAQFASVIDEVRSAGRGAVPGLPVSDTIKRTDGFGLALATVDRSELSAVQTPQGFPRQQLQRAYEFAADEFTDDAALVAAAGFEVAIIHGDPLAFKITTAWDLRRAEQELAPAPEHRAWRTGVGLDAHAFVTGGPGHPEADADAEFVGTPEAAPVPEHAEELWLAGLFWPGERGLVGHSDGDAVVHAICDALLSASGLGDLGSVFGTADPRFEGAHGDVFLRHTAALLAGAGFRIANVSVQLVTNRPLFSPRRLEAQAVLSAQLGAPVTVSATTTDGLGFTGRNEGVLAIASCVVHPAQ
ncbi:2-C-methyl-D-erythritol 4-phosphate cytidylyltransferase [Subtercola frigoramans]|uniref:Bifunctional enzyme IspD/IspF n=1 Tax=Subtercola frigoramans TaxID=120298 RepID=A0ABS2L3K5_9MICO|nr:2-C-methyl-D-erythritol 4-phosphate cytidylyltransferase [Subtercola frigoramans]MBM7471471.1 2-C-methyl-D-erythritol 4-phosphate cytidylyltransferase/2-C-methyl-D-erythritol 2,4-cyclodiphosphate synthase [Subtercola frigoramans]